MSQEPIVKNKKESLETFEVGWTRTGHTKGNSWGYGLLNFEKIYHKRRKENDESSSRETKTGNSRTNNI